MTLGETLTSAELTQKLINYTSLILIGPGDMWIKHHVKYEGATSKNKYFIAIQTLQDYENCEFYIFCIKRMIFRVNYSILKLS